MAPGLQRFTHMMHQQRNMLANMLTITNTTQEDWTCAAINFHIKPTYYSLGGKGENVLQTLLRYLKEEHEKKKDSPLPNLKSTKLALVIPTTEH